MMAGAQSEAELTVAKDSLCASSHPDPATGPYCGPGPGQARRSHTSHAVTCCPVGAIAHHTGQGTARPRQVPGRYVL